MRCCGVQTGRLCSTENLSVQNKNKGGKLKREGKKERFSESATHETLWRRAYKQNEHESRNGHERTMLKQPTLSKYTSGTTEPSLKHLGFPNCALFRSQPCNGKGTQVHSLRGRRREYQTPLCKLRVLCMAIIQPREKKKGNLLDESKNGEKKKN